MERKQELPVTETGGTCMICSEQKEIGIHIFSQFLCAECEREIVQSSVDDERYPYYIDRMKQIWLELIS